MDDSQEWYEKAKEELQFCPKDAQRLEQHPNDPRKLSCYAHGDFVITRMGEDNQDVYTWHALRPVHPKNR